MIYRLSPVVPFLIMIITLACSPGKVNHPQNEGYLYGADSAKIYYRVIGSAPDTLVAIHGGPGAGMHSILPSFKPLAENFTLIFYDQRGGGRSALPSDTTKLKPDYYVEDLDAVRQFFGINKMNIVTHSFGAILAARYARKYPKNLDRLVFHGATGPSLQQELKLRKTGATVSPPSPDPELSARSSELLRMLLNGTASDPLETCRQYEEINRKLSLTRGDSILYRGTTCNAPPEAIRYYYRYTVQLAPRYYGNWDFTNKLGMLKAPLLVVYGKKDTLMHPAQRSWVSSVPNGRLLLVPGAEKGAFSANPEFVFPAVDSFFHGKWPELAFIPN